VVYCRVIAAAVLYSAVLTYWPYGVVFAQAPGTQPAAPTPTKPAATVPDDVTKAIAALAQALKAVPAGSDGFTASVKAVDAMLASVRNKNDPDYIKMITDDLKGHIDGLKDDKSKAAAWTALKDLWTAINGVREKSADGTVALIGVLNTDLGQNLTDMDKDKITASLTTLGKSLDTIVASRGQKIHIISAQYGDIGGRNPRRKCDAKAYFIGACEGKAFCPVQPQSGTADVLDGPTVCGYEPAPLAADGVSYARVVYKCIYVGMRGFAEIQRTESFGGTPIKLHKKDKIVCQPQN
jgi:hypothetical protein